MCWKLSYEIVHNFISVEIKDKLKLRRCWLTGHTQRIEINGQASEKLNITSDGPQGSVLGLVLFFVYNNDTDNGLYLKISKFADNSKLSNKFNTEIQCLQLQTDIDKQVDCSYIWQMNFHINKHKSLIEQW